MDSRWRGTHACRRRQVCSGSQVYGATRCHARSHTRRDHNGLPRGHPTTMLRCGKNWGYKDETCKDQKSAHGKHLSQKQPGPYLLMMRPLSDWFQAFVATKRPVPLSSPGRDVPANGLTPSILCCPPRFSLAGGCVITVEPWNVPRAKGWPALLLKKPCRNSTEAGSQGTPACPPLRK